MSERYSELVRRLREHVLLGAGETEPALRQALAASGAVPPELQTYADKVRRHAYRVTDEDIIALKRAGYSENAIFEITVSAAVGAALARLERGMSALKEAR